MATGRSWCPATAFALRAVVGPDPAALRAEHPEDQRQRARLNLRRSATRAAQAEGHAARVVSLRSANVRLAFEASRDEDATVWEQSRRMGGQGASRRRPRRSRGRGRSVGRPGRLSVAARAARRGEKGCQLIGPRNLPGPTLHSADAALPVLRRREPRALPALRVLRRGARAAFRRARDPQDGDHPVHGRQRLDGARRAARPGIAAGRHGPLLREHARSDRAPWRNGREIHRRRGDGGLRGPRGARGGRPPGRARRGGDARGAQTAERRSA
jgi:hypothetical protein